MKIIENALPQELFNKIYDQVADVNTAWYYSETAYPDEGDDLFNYSYCHVAYLEGEVKSHTCKDIWTAIKHILSNNGEELEELIRIRIGLIPVTETQYCHKPHVDYEYEHKTGIIYLNECNGPTMFYKEKFDTASEIGAKDQHKVFTLDKKILPKENKVVLFDGLTYHNSSTPTDTHRRLAINFNYRTK